MTVSTFTYRNSVNSLANFTSPGLIVPNLRGRDVATIIQELSNVLLREARIPDLLPFYRAAINREFLSNTATNHGFAFPHARLDVLSGLSFALGRTPEPIEWDIRNGSSIRLIFLIAIPATESLNYLALVSGLTQLSKDDELLLKLNCAQDAFEILAILQQVKLRVTPKAFVS